MAPYNIFPAVNENYTFPPKVIDGIVNSPEFLALRWAKPLSAAITDLNDVVENGLYPVTNDLLHRPVAKSGSLTVRTVGEIALQEYTTLDGEVQTYVRGRVGSGSWTSWETIGSGGGTAPVSSWSKVADSTINDLDLFVDEGRYSVTTPGVANRPIAAAGHLLVLFANNTVVQEWTTLDASPRVFIRQRSSGGAWSEWRDYYMGDPSVDWTAAIAALHAAAQ